MAKENSELLTAGKIAAQLGVSGSVVSKTIKTLNLKPDLVKGGCNYFGKENIDKIKKAVK
ncbi:MAG: HTH domain-containing protein [Ignavibacteriales bacterium]|nr:HTH domain-containing protein [Ignavibacteriales bacterium]MBK7981198.1 HTH domain-containing protein [Ignavibacteriota bacterium]